MSILFVTEKASGRIVFMVPAGTPLMVDGLYTTVDYRYVDWPGYLPLDWKPDSPWDWLIRGDTIVYNQVVHPHIDYYVERHKRAIALQRIGMVVQRQREFAYKHLLGQQNVYAAKAVQAQAVADNNNPGISADSYPYVRDYAQLVGLSLKDAAAQILFRWGQQQQVLADTEKRRMELTKLVLESDSISFMTALSEVAAYEHTA